MYEIRTDLALEAREKYEQDNVEIKGVRLDKETIADDIRVTTMVIETENGARSMGRPKGSYITIEAASMDDEDEHYHRIISERLAQLIRQLSPEGERLSALVVGLGNREVTSDSLGPKVVDQLFVTRHMMREFGSDIFGKQQKQVSAIVPGVMAQTGMESSEIIRGILAETKPDFVIAVDALAARNSKRLNRTVQIADTGIHPGSGVGNHRNGLTEENLQVKVIGIGVPTVVDAATIVHDSMEHLLDALEETEQKEFLEEMIAPNLYSMFVTPKDVDETVKYLSFTISEGLNIAFSEV